MRIPMDCSPSFRKMLDTTVYTENGMANWVTCMATEDTFCSLGHNNNIFT